MRLTIIILAMMFSVVLISSLAKAATYTRDIMNMVYDNKNFSITSYAQTALGMAIKPDGKIFYVSDLNTNTVYQFNSTGWNVSQMSFNNSRYNIAGSTTGLQGMAISADGTKLYITSDDTDMVHQFTMSDPWNVNSSTYDNKNLSVAVQESTPRNIWFKPDGTRLYLVGNGMDRVHQYNLSTPWDISTATYNAADNFSVGTYDATPIGLTFKPDGTKYWVYGYTNDILWEFNMTTPWNINSSVFYGINRSLFAQSGLMSDIEFSTDGSMMFGLDYDKDFIHQYSNASSGAPDTIRPKVKIFSPGNSSYRTATILFEINATDNIAMDSCWYSLNGGIFNYSMTNDSANYTNTNTTMKQGGIKMNAYCNDSSGNINNTEFIHFYIDSIAPVFTNLRNFTVQLNSYFSNSITATDGVGIDTYKLNDTSVFQINKTTGLINNTASLYSLTTYWLNISANDTTNNLVSDIFFINVTLGGLLTATTNCRYTNYGFYNPNLAFIKEVDCDENTLLAQFGYYH